MQSRVLIRRLISVALCILSLAALALPLAPGGEPSGLAAGVLLALGAAVMWLLYDAWLRMERPLAPMRLWVLAGLFALVMVLGQSFSAVGTAELFTGRKLRALLGLVGRAPLYFAGMRVLSRALAREAKPSARCLPGPPCVWLGGCLLMCWLPWYACLYPGTVSNDSITQLKEILGVVPLSNGNPVFQTWLVAAFRQAGLWLGSADAGVALYCVTQAMLMAWLLGVLLSYMWRGAAPRWLCWRSLAFYALCPIFPVFAFCVGKDTNFAMAVLFLSLMIKRLVDTPAGRPFGGGPTARLCLAAVLCTLLRNPGVYLALITLGLTLLWTLARRRQWRAPVCGLACVAAVYAALHLLVLPGLSIAPMPETENYSLPLQQVARVAAGNALTPQQAAAVNGVLPVDQLKDAYNGELSDPVKNLWRADVTGEQKRAFWRAWPGIVASNPMTCLSATFHNTYGYLSPGYLSQIKPTLLIGDQSTRTASIKGLYDYSVNPRSAALKAFCDRLAQNPMYRVLISPGLYGWIALFAAVSLLRGSSRRNLLCVVPALFTLAGCLLSAVNGYFRYAMPLYLSAPLLLWAAGSPPCAQGPRAAMRA